MPDTSTGNSFQTSCDIMFIEPFLYSTVLIMSNIFSEEKKYESDREWKLAHNPNKQTVEFILSEQGL